MTATNVSFGLTATATWLPGDDDRDGLTNAQEINDYKTLPGNRDTDGDGLDDGQEVHDFRTNPLSTDTDSDGLKDGEEVSQGLDPTKRDTDGDGTPDNADTAPNATPTLPPSPTIQLPTTQVPTTQVPAPTTQAATPTLYVNDFEGSAGLEWSKNKTTRSPSGRNFLGDFSNETVRLTLLDLPDHSTAKINVDLYIIRSWDGNAGPDIWMLEVPGIRTLLRTTFSNFPPSQQAYPDLFGGGAEHPLRTGADEIDTLQFIYSTGVLDTVYNLSFSFSHSGPSLVFDFSASGLQDIEDESWGLDNVEVIFE